MGASPSAGTGCPSSHPPSWRALKSPTGRRNRPPFVPTKRRLTPEAGTQPSFSQRKRCRTLLLSLLIRPTTLPSTSRETRTDGTSAKTMAQKRLMQELQPLQKEKWVHIEVRRHPSHHPAVPRCATPIPPRGLMSHQLTSLASPVGRQQPVPLARRVLGGES